MLVMQAVENLLLPSGEFTRILACLGTDDIKWLHTIIIAVDQYVILATAAVNLFQFRRHMICFNLVAF
jgi:hypothetical protein